MYKAGEMILYGRTGVCIVEEVTEKLLKGEREPQFFYSLKPLYQSCSITIPVTSKAFSRPVISAEEAQELLESLGTLEAEPYNNRNLNQLREHYKTEIESFDCRTLALMIASIYRKKREAEEQKRKLGAVDERFLKEAEDLLCGELAAVLGTERMQVQKIIYTALV